MSDIIAKLSIEDVALMNFILMDPTIITSFVEESKKEKYKTRDISAIDGTIIFGKSKWRWLNRLLGDEIKIDFLTFSLKTVAAISGQKNNYNERILSALTKEVLTKAVMKGDYSYIIHRLFDAYHYGVKAYTGSKTDNTEDLNDLVNECDEITRRQIEEIKRKLRCSNSYNVTLNSGESIGSLKLTIGQI